MTPGAEGPLVGVGVVVVSDGALLLVRRGRPPGRGLWAVPGGKVERGESLREAARREVREETGIHVEVGDVAWVGEHISSDHHIVLIDFWGEPSPGSPRPGDDAEDVAWVRFEDAGSYPLTETMHDLLEKLGN